MTTEITCPRCQTSIAKLLMAKLPVDSERHPAVFLCCPACNEVLPAQFDPLAVAAEVRGNLLQELKDHLTKQA